MAIVLLGDVGGTNTRLRLFRFSAEQEELVAEAILPSQSTATFQALLDTFLANKERPSAAVIGIAGPVANNSCTITNVGWPTIIGDQLAEHFGMAPGKFVLLNDFEVIGYGVLDLTDDQIININEAAPVPGRPKAVIGAGTGIGECLLTAHNGEYVVWPGEGGHCDFFPHNSEEEEYAHYIL